MASDDEPNALIGQTVGGKYRVDRLLGRGGMGAVYQATHVAIGKRIALKFLDRQSARDSDSTSRFHREAEAASAVESAHIVHIFDSGRSEDGLPFLVMEFLEGEDLRARLRREGRLEVDEVLRIAAQVLKGLGRAHRAGIVHRDLKPDNVFLCEREDEQLVVKIVDFGISKLKRPASADTLTQRGTVLGTAFYMSPEQAQAFVDIDGRADLFSLGAILYEALSGRPPHIGTAYEAVLIDICTKDADDIRTYAPQVPAAIALVIQKALARDRDERYATAEDFYDALAAAAPDVLNASGRGPRTTGRSAVDAKSRGAQATDAASAEKVRTAEGAVVKPTSHDARAARRRTIVTAIVAALGAFALTALLMERNTPPPEPLGTAERVPAVATPVEPKAAATPPASAPEVVPAVADTAPKPKSTPAVAGRPTHSSKTTAAKPPPSATAATTSGVAGSLKLNTKGP